MAKLEGYYSSGEFAKMAHVSVRTIRFYDKQNILKPSFVDKNGSRFYTDSDLARLQQIVLLKYLGFSLDDIAEMTIDDSDYHFMLASLKLQKKMIEDKIEQMQLVEKAIEETASKIESKKKIDWSQMLEIIHLANMENSLKTQYQNTSNIAARIQLHKKYSINRQGWFPWIYQQLENCCELDHGKKQILEIGCGSGALWHENIDKLPANIGITLSDISEGMVRDIKRSFDNDKRFEFNSFDCHKIPYDDQSFDVVIANHVLFYCYDVSKVCQEIRRVLKKEKGIFICSTYGSSHMQEITQLVQQFDNRIVLSGEKLYEKFGLDNGETILSQCFNFVERIDYDDEIVISNAVPLIEYILSCHGNQNQYILDRYNDFKDFVEKTVKDNFHITKSAGIFICKV